MFDDVSIGEAEQSCDPVSVEPAGLEQFRNSYHLPGSKFDPSSTDGLAVVSSTLDSPESLVASAAAAYAARKRIHGNCVPTLAESAATAVGSARSSRFQRSTGTDLTLSPEKLSPSAVAMYSEMKMKFMSQELEMYFPVAEPDDAPKLREWYGVPFRCLQSEEACGGLVDLIVKEPVYYLLYPKELIHSPYGYLQREEGETFLRKLLGDGCVRNTNARMATDESTGLEFFLQEKGEPKSKFDQQFEIGPKLRNVTPWCCHVINMVKSSKLQLQRIERTFKYYVSLKKSETESVEQLQERVIKLLHDPILEHVYEEPISCFYDNMQQPKNEKLWVEVPLLTMGKGLLRQINIDKALGFDAEDEDFYYTFFVDALKRNPTMVELMDLAQTNSEHSRHWFFKGQYIIGNEKMSKSLMDMVIETNGDTTSQNNVIKFHDNSSAINGFNVTSIKPSKPFAFSNFILEDSKKNLLLTAETHNFPTGVEPFSGAATGTGGRLRDVMAAGRGGTVVAATAGYSVGQLHIKGYRMPWEHIDQIAGDFELPLNIIIQASNGASDYGNKFGEPVIGGFFRAVGMEVNRELREYVKPIMFSAGIGLIEDKHVDKVSITIKPETPLPPSDQDSGTDSDGEVSRQQYKIRRLKIGKIGGPAYRIGMGGGTASSAVTVEGACKQMTKEAVQRGDPEMGNRLNRFVRACIEMGPNNPIMSIHDQGAGGNANVLREIVDGHGANISADRFTTGDSLLSLEELWCAEYQESNAILYDYKDVDMLRTIALRERCTLDEVGSIMDGDRFRFVHKEQALTSTAPVPVDFPLTRLERSRRKTFRMQKYEQKREKLNFDEELSIREAVHRVLKLPSVASKRFLVTKVDRSVSGLVAQQQCVGALQVPLADVAVTACGFFSHEGIATSIGEQPVIGLVNPEAGARMSLMEALCGIIMAPITCLKDVKCSVNWMWPAKQPGPDDHALVLACKALCDQMKLLGVAVDGGKDSLSMAAKVNNPMRGAKSNVVKAPGTVVVSAYAPCRDITRVLTPDLKGPRRGMNSTLLWVRPVNKCRMNLGGSALAQVYKELGCRSPDVTPDDAAVFVNMFPIIQRLIRYDSILAGHDVSEGGLIVCLLEMAIAGNCGLEVTLPLLRKSESDFKKSEDGASISVDLAKLFSEEIGWVMEVSDEHLEKVTERLIKFHCFKIGTTTAANEMVFIKNAEGKLLYKDDLSTIRSSWEETSYRLELHQTRQKVAEREYAAFKKPVKTAPYVCNFEYRHRMSVEEMGKLPKTAPCVAVIREEGTNGDRELVAAFMMAGFSVYDIAMTDLYDKKGFKLRLDRFRGIAFPGGFSYADSLGAAVGWAASLKGDATARGLLREWRHRMETFSIAICNGCQLTSLLGWQNLDGGHSHDYESSPDIRYKTNLSGRFESRWAKVKIGATKNIFMKDMEDAVLGIWVAHKEGRISCTDENFKLYEDKQMIALRYVDEEGVPTEDYPMNPNGSRGGVAGISSPCGRHLAMMPHPERCVLPWQWPDRGPEQETLMKMAEDYDLNDMDNVDPIRDTAPWAKMFQNAYDWCMDTDNHQDFLLDDSVTEED